MLINDADTLLLDGSVEDYEYLNKSRREVDGIDDREEWSLLKNALDIRHAPDYWDVQTEESCRLLVGLADDPEDFVLHLRR